MLEKRTNFLFEVDRLVKDHRERVRRGEPKLDMEDVAYPNYEPVVVQAVLEDKPYPAKIVSELKNIHKKYDLPYILKRELMRQDEMDSVIPSG